MAVDPVRPGRATDRDGAGGATRVRIGLSLLVVLVCWLATKVNSSSERSIAHALAPPPNGVRWLVTSVWWLGSFGLIAIVVILALVSRRWSVIRDCLLSGAGAWLICVLLGLLLGSDGGRPSSGVPLGFSVVFPVARVAATVAVAGAALPYLSRWLQRAIRVAIVLLALATIVAQAGLPVAVLASLAVGVFATAVVHLAFGSPLGLLSASEVAVLIHSLGIEVTGLTPVAVQEWGVGRFVAYSDGAPIEIAVYGRDASDAQLLAKTARFMLYRDSGPTLTLTRRQQVEHEAYLTLLADRAGVRVVPGPRRRACRTGPGRPPRDLRPPGATAGRVRHVRAGPAPDPGDAPSGRRPRPAVGSAVVTADEARAANGAADEGESAVLPQIRPRPRRTTPRPSTGRQSATRPSTTSSARSSACVRPASPTGDCLWSRSTWTTRDGPEWSTCGRHPPWRVPSSSTGTWPPRWRQRRWWPAPSGRSHRLPGSCPRTRWWLHFRSCSAPALNPVASRSMRGKKGYLTALREQGAKEADVEVPKLMEPRRINWVDLALVVGTLIGGWALIGVLVNVTKSWSTITGAKWGWVVATFVLAQAVYPGLALATVGSVTDTMPFGRTVALEVANTFVSLAGGSMGALATRVRYFQQQGYDATLAVSSGVLISTASWIVKGGMFLIALPIALSQFDFGAPNDTGGGSGSSTANLVWLIVIAIVVVGVVVGLLFAVPRWRRLAAAKLRPKASEVWGHFRVLATHPRNVVEIFGGEIIGQLLVALALGTSLHAFGEHLSLAALLIVLTLGSMLGGISPVPGGMGIVEAGMIIGLTAAGVPESEAVAAVFVQRLFTAYLPPIWGWFCLVWMRKKEYL